MESEAVVVLGCRIVRSRGGELVFAAKRRAEAASRAVFAMTRPEREIVVIVSGGRAWTGRIEADVIAEELVRAGVRERAIVRERRSHNTRENACFTRQILARRAIDRVTLVTCTWHMPRASALFRAEGFVVEPWPADPGPAPWRVRAYRVVRERVASRLDRMMT